MHFKQFETNQIPNQTKSGCIKVGEFFKRSVKLRLQDNDIEMLLTQNERKSVVAERFIRTLKNKIYTIYDCNIAKYVHWQGLFQPLF